MDNIILLVLCVCGGILAASQQRTYYDEEILTEIRQNLREELKAEIQELMQHNKAVEDDELSQSHNILLEEITILRNEMAMLKTEVTSLKSNLGEKSKKLVTLQEQTEAMKISMTALEDDLAATRKEVNILKEEMTERNTNYGQETEHVERSQGTTEPEDDTENVVQSTKAGSGFVAFSASRTTDLGPVIVDTTITYNVLEVSIGGGFEPSTGIFTVPVTGLYLIHMGGQGDNVVVYYYINQGVYRVARTGTAPSPYGTAANAAILQLTAGDLVRTELNAGVGSAHLQCGTSGPCYMGGFLLHQTI